MKKIFVTGITIFLILLSINTVLAEEQSFTFNLSVDGKNEKNVETGDVITINLSLSCLGNKSCLITSFQDEIFYDSEFYELVEGSQLTMNGVSTNDIALKDRYRAYYMNFLSFDGPIEVPQNTVIGSVQFRVIADTGVSRIKNSNCEVTDENGETYLTVQEKENDVVTIRSNQIEVHIKDNNNTLIDDKYVEYQKPMKKPNVTNNEGQIANSWYQDQEAASEWNFEDKVEENMTIFGHDWNEKTLDNNLIFASTILVLIVLIIFIILIKKRKKEKEKLS